MRAEHDQLKDRLEGLGFTLQDEDGQSWGGVEEWAVPGGPTVLVGTNPERGDYPHLLALAGRELDTYEQAREAAQQVEQSGATRRGAGEERLRILNLLATERESLAVKMRDGELPMDMRFLDGVAHAWSRILFMKDNPQSGGDAQDEEAGMPSGAS